MKQYEVPTNPANLTWTRAYTFEATNLTGAINALYALDYLQMRTYGLNTLTMHVSTVIDTVSDPAHVLTILDDFASLAADNDGTLSVGCFTERYANVFITFGNVVSGTESQPVYKLDLGNIYFRSLNTNGDEMGTDVDNQALYARLITLARDASDVEHLTAAAQTFATT